MHQAYCLPAYRSRTHSATGAFPAAAREGTFFSRLRGFGICQLLGLRYAPASAISPTNVSTPFEKASTSPTLEPLIGERINVRQIESQWEELLRLATSIRQGTVTASLVLRKLASYPRQKGLAWGLCEIGRIGRTLFTLDWLQP
jgi:TnpA family transposase